MKPFGMRMETGCSRGKTFFLTNWERLKPIAFSSLENKLDCLPQMVENVYEFSRVFARFSPILPRGHSSAKALEGISNLGAQPGQGRQEPAQAVE